MRLGIRMLNNISTLNNLIYVNQVRINPGENYTVYFQLVDLDQQDPYQQKAPVRYIPIIGSTMNLNLTSINVLNNISKIPTNPFTDDRSIWSFNLASSDTQIAAGVNMSVTLTEGSNIRIANAPAVIIFGSQSVYSA